jgi:tripartite-type tricarboxylate transporter receptor subunit TctC
VRFRHLVGNGGGPAMTAVLSGNAAAYAAPPAVVTPHILSGRARVLAHWGNKRLPAFPNLPSLRELGFTSEFYDWRVLFVPAKTPPAVVKALQDALRAAVQDPQFKAEMERVNQTMDYRDGGDFSTWYEAERKRLTDTVRAIGKVDEAR